MAVEERDFRDLVRTLARLETEMKQARDDIGKLSAQQQLILGQMNRWKGAVPAMLFVGSVVTWFIVKWEAVVRMFKS